MTQLHAKEEITEFVRAEIELFKDLALRDRVAKFLISPSLQTRKWAKPPYPEVPCWIIADFRVDGFQGRGVGAAYCQLGHGENGYFWNLVLLRDEEYLDSGNNNCYKTLEELASDSGYCD